MVVLASFDGGDGDYRRNLRRLFQQRFFEPGG
jgi:hypothetical protein